MSKVICDICGTSYPDTAAQCPICGCVRPAQTVAVEEPVQETNGYTYVKGGRFSKSNVRKKNHKSVGASHNTSDAQKASQKSIREKTPMDKKRLGLVIVLVCLLLIVISMVIYIAVTLKDNDPPAPNNGILSEDVICTGLQVSPLDFTMTKNGEVLKLSVTCTPENTTDTVVFSENSEGKVVTVDQNGNVTCVGNGKAVITVTCGDQIRECRVICTVEDVQPEPTEPEIQIRLFSYHVELTFEKEQFPLYANGDVTAAELTWVSEDPAVATVDNDGIVYAVANGETVVHAKYLDKVIASSQIKCNFQDFEVDDSQEGGETVPEDEFYFGSVFGQLLPEGQDLYGTSLKTGDKIQFGLIHKTDRSKNIYFQWERVNPNDADQSVVASEDKLTIIRNSAPDINGSYCLFKATYEGKEYFLKIRYWG